MKTLDIFKGVAELVVSVGVSAIVGNTIKTTTPPDIHLIKKVCVGVGGFVLSAMVGDKTAEYTSKQIDDATEKIRQAISKPSREEKEEVVKRIASELRITIHKYKADSERLTVKFINGTSVDFESFDDLYNYLTEAFGK